jgi:hypothetical protein
MSQAKVTKRSKFLYNFVMGESKHESQRHIFHPNELEVPRVIVHVQVAQPAGGCIGHMIGNRRRDIIYTSNRRVVPGN